MKLDICAPQVIFPDDFQSGDPMLVVVDLGRILLTNSQGKAINHFTKEIKCIYILWFVTQLIPIVIHFL